MNRQKPSRDEGVLQTPNWPAGTDISMSRLALIPETLMSSSHRCPGGPDPFRANASQIVARWSVRLAHESKSLARTDKSRAGPNATKKY